MGLRNKLILTYLAAGEAGKDGARLKALRACGSPDKFNRAMKEAARRGWTNADGITEMGRQRLARYPDEHVPMPSPVIIRPEVDKLLVPDSDYPNRSELAEMIDTFDIPAAPISEAITIADVKLKRARKPAAKPKKRAKKRG